MKSFLLTVAFSLLLVLLHFNILSFFGPMQKVVNVLILAALYRTATAGARAGLLLSAVGGAFFEWFAVAPPGLWILTTALTVGSTALLLERYVTNRSLVALFFVTIIGTAIWNGAFWAGTAMVKLFGSETTFSLSSRFFSAAAGQIVIHGALMVTLALLFPQMRRRFGTANLGHATR